MITIVLALMDANMGAFDPNDLYLGAFILDLMIIMATTEVLKSK